MGFVWAQAAAVKRIEAALGLVCGKTVMHGTWQGSGDHPGIARRSLLA